MKISKMSSSNTSCILSETLNAGKVFKKSLNIDDKGINNDSESEIEDLESVMKFRTCNPIL